MALASDPARLADQLHRLFAAIEANCRALLPSSNLELLQSIVDAAATIFGAAAASVCLVDGAQATLTFMVAYGVGREDIVGRRMPVDQGIAGYVAMTGQPIAVSNVQQDPRFKSDFAKSTGYVPRAILATPLLSGDRVIGVMEVLDKIDAPAFGLEDMQLLGVFARQAALAIHQSQQFDRLGAQLWEGLQQLMAADPNAPPVELLEVLRPAGEAAGLEDDLLELASLFYTLSAAGPAERQACLKMLGGFADYVRARPGFY